MLFVGQVGTLRPIVHHWRTTASLSGLACGLLSVGPVKDPSIQLDSLAGVYARDLIELAYLGTAPSIWWYGTVQWVAPYLSKGIAWEEG